MSKQVLNIVITLLHQRHPKPVPHVLPLPQPYSIAPFFPNLLISIYLYQLLEKFLSQPTVPPIYEWPSRLSDSDITESKTYEFIIILPNAFVENAPEHRELCKLSAPKKHITLTLYCNALWHYTLSVAEIHLEGIQS